MKYFEIVNTVYLKNDIDFRNVQSVLSKFINFSMESKESLSKLHSGNGIKLYCYDYLFPREEDKIYKKGRVYVFKVRTPVKSIAIDISRAISNTENDYIKALGSNLSEKSYRYRESFYTATPVVCTLGKKYWTKEEGIDVLEEKIEKNLVSKYKLIFGCEPSRNKDFLNLIEIKNNRNILIKYKNGNVIGHKLRVGFLTDDLSINMSYVSYTTGLLEKSSSLGTGFCV